MVNDFELGFFPTKGRYPAEVVAQALEVRGEPPLAVMHVDARAPGSNIRGWPAKANTPRLKGMTMVHLSPLSSRTSAPLQGSQPPAKAIAVSARS